MADYLMPWDDDSCSVVDRVLAIVEPKHTMLILAILILDGPMHFGELRRALGGISAKMLSSRLHALEEQGLLSRRDEFEGRIRRTRYIPTASAIAFYEVLCAMRDWGRRHEGGEGNRPVDDSVAASSRWAAGGGSTG